MAEGIAIEWQAKARIRKVENAFILTRVSVQGDKSLGVHFACLCREFDFYEVKKILLFFKKKREILLHF